MKVESNMDVARVAADIRKIADQVERGDFIAVGVAMCDMEGNGMHGCCLKQEFATPELIDCMLHETKAALFAALED